MTELTAAIYLTDDHTELLIALFYKWQLPHKPGWLSRSSYA